MKGDRRRGIGRVVALMRTEKRRLSGYVFAGMGRSLAQIATLLLIRDFLAEAVGEPTGIAAWLGTQFGGHAPLALVASLLLLSALASAGFTYLSAVWLQQCAKVIELGTLDHLVRHLLRLSVSYFDRQTHGDLVTAVRKDVAELRLFALSALVCITESVIALGALGAAVWLSPELALWIFVVLPAVAFPILLVARRVGLRSLVIRRLGYDLFDRVLGVIRGIRLIKVYQGEAREAESIHDAADTLYEHGVEMVKARALARTLLESLAGLGSVLILLIGGVQVLEGTLSWPALLAFLMAFRALQGPLERVNSNLVGMQAHSAAVRRIDEILGEHPGPPEVETPQPLAPGGQVLALDDVSFAYPDGTWALQGVSFTTQPGEVLGVCGKSGSGKSTLLGLLSRLYDPARGHIRFGEVDLREAHLHELHSRMALVTQHPILFADTVRENIRYGTPEASDAEVEAAAKAAYVHDEVLALPEGYDTVIGLGGRTLSGGQAQRVTIARALLQDASLLLMDEPASSLDTLSEEKVLETIAQPAEARTTVVVTQRLSLLRAADRILVLDAGCVAGLDTHEALLTTCEPYQALWKAQHG